MPSPTDSLTLGALARQLLNQPGLLPVKHGIRELQTWLNLSDFQRFQQLSNSLLLTPLRERQPRFSHKYLSGYLAVSLPRSARLAALSNHYHFLADTARANFFETVARRPVLWQERRGDDHFTIDLSYPLVASFEAELSLNFSLNGTLLQVVAFVIVPGRLVGGAEGPALLFSQVQGSREPALLKHATRTLLDTTPAALLVQAAYGLAAALGIGQAAGLSSAEQMSAGPGSRFDYDGFWRQFGGEQRAGGWFGLRIPAPERPIAHIKSNNRGRTLRKRRFKLLLRAAVEEFCRGAFLKSGQG